MWAMIGTWRMALEGIQEATGLLQAGRCAGDAVEEAIRITEDFPYFKSVGYGGLPNEEMEVELDAGYMDGTTLAVGAVCALQDFRNPISIARALSNETYNNVLAGAGAEKYAHQRGFERRNMLTERAKIHYARRCEENEKKETSTLRPYIGHDTVGVIGLDVQGGLVAGTSTSGLFMKRKGRVGDSPLVGSGFYADAKVGAATATGLGEDLMKGCVSFAIVQAMRQGISPQAACDRVVNDLASQLRQRTGTVGDLSVIAMNAEGDWGIATNVDNFSFVYASEDQAPTVYRTRVQQGKTSYFLADEAWLEDYMKTRTAPLTIDGKELL